MVTPAVPQHAAGPTSASLLTRPRNCPFPLKKPITPHIRVVMAVLSLPLPFCQAVYQDRLRKDVKKMIAVATVPFLSLISFQRCLSSAECRGPRSCRWLPPSVSLRLQGVETGVGAGIWGRQTVKKRCSQTGLRALTSTLRWSWCVFSCRCSEGCWLLLYRPTAVGHESTDSP